jgi:hypothetical protein
LSMRPELPEPKGKSFWQQIEDVLDDMYGRVWRLALVVLLVSIPIGTGLAFGVTSYRARPPTPTPHAPWPGTLSASSRIETPAPIRVPVVHKGVRVMLISVKVYEAIPLVNEPPLEPEPGMAWLGMYLRLDTPDGRQALFSMDEFTVLDREGRPFHAHLTGVEEPSFVHNMENVKLYWDGGPQLLLLDPQYVVLVFQIEDVPHDVLLFWDWGSEETSPFITVPYPP